MIFFDVKLVLFIRIYCLYTMNTVHYLVSVFYIAMSAYYVIFLLYI